jgi:hypothetical protein
MTFNQKLANYVLGSLTVSDLPDVAMTGINEGLESESLLILAGFCKNENDFEILSYFKKALFELKIELKSEKEAAIEIIHFYALEILNGKISISKGINIIVKNVLDATSLWREITYAPYDCIHFDTLYSLYWQLEELLNDKVLIESVKRKQLILETENEIKQELKVWINNLKIN